MPKDEKKHKKVKFKNNKCKGIAWSKREKGKPMPKDIFSSKGK